MPWCQCNCYKRRLKLYKYYWEPYWRLRGHFTCLIWGWKSRCRSLSPSCPPSRSSPCLSRPRRRQCPPGTWRASGRRKDRRKICTRPGSWSARGRCDWATGSVWWGDREEAERPTDLRGGRGTGTNDVSIGRQRVRVRREKEWAVGESTVTHQQATSEPDKHKEETEKKNGRSVYIMRVWSPNSLRSESHALSKRCETPYWILTDRKAWTMSALTELRGLSLMTMKICSSFSKLIKFPNHDFLANLGARQENYHVWGTAGERTLDCGSKRL